MSYLQHGHQTETHTPTTHTNKHQHISTRKCTPTHPRKHAQEHTGTATNTGRGAHTRTGTHAGTHITRQHATQQDNIHVLRTAGARTVVLGRVRPRRVGGQQRIIRLLRELQLSGGHCGRGGVGRTGALSSVNKRTVYSRQLAVSRSPFQTDSPCDSPRTTPHGHRAAASIPSSLVNPFLPIFVQSLPSPTAPQKGMHRRASCTSGAGSMRGNRGQMRGAASPCASPKMSSNSASLPPSIGSSKKGSVCDLPG